MLEGTHRTGIFFIGSLSVFKIRVTEVVYWYCLEGLEGDVSVDKDKNTWF